MPDKTPCRTARRYVNQLDPSLLSDPWTAEEDRTIVKFQVCVSFSIPGGQDLCCHPKQLRPAGLADTAPGDSGVTK